MEIYLIINFLLSILLEVMSERKFHIGLCMAGSVSAGAYTAGVIDYLHEALDNWQQAKASGDESLPNHEAVIDLMGGASGGGITAALAFFALRSKINHASLSKDGATFKVDSNENLYWRTWVDLTENDIFSELLNEDDISEGYIPSLLNSSFVDEVAEIFKLAIDTAATTQLPHNYIHDKAELFVTLFNVTGIKYEINSRSPSARKQYMSEHRDMAHFQWGDEYEGDGRMEVSFAQRRNLNTLLDAAKATGAFPAGLSARLITREARYIWENPFFLKNKFEKVNIKLGNDIVADDDKYTTLNGDGGTANNEPIEFCRDLMLNIRIKDYKDLPDSLNNELSNDTEKAIKRKSLTNSSVILIDPFPSYDFDLETPSQASVHIFKYVPKFVFALASQLIFDAKDAFDAYDKDSYGLHIIAPSKRGVAKPQHAIACGSLGGFGGFFSREFRIHDFFLGRHNCQSFLRKHFTVALDEPQGTEAYECVRSVINGYKDNPEAIKRFSYEDENGRRLVPIIPDLNMKVGNNIKVESADLPTGEKIIEYVDPEPLPLYKLKKLSKEYFLDHKDEIKKRIRKIITSMVDANFFVDIVINQIAKAVDDKIAEKIIEVILEDLDERGLLEK